MAPITPLDTSNLSDSVFDEAGNAVETLTSSPIEKSVKPPKFTLKSTRSCGSSDQPAVCRICHGSEGSSPFCGGEPLIAPCFCKGTMGLYHRSCLEHWLASSNTNQCEICKHPYVTMRRPKPLIEFIKQPGSRSARRNMIGDFICLLLLTPLATVSSWLCLAGAVHYAEIGRTKVELPGLICLALFLLITYSVWLSVSLRYHYRVWQEWREHNHEVHLVLEHGRHGSKQNKSSQRGRKSASEPRPRNSNRWTGPRQGNSRISPLAGTSSNLNNYQQPVASSFTFSPSIYTGISMETMV